MYLINCYDVTEKEWLETDDVPFAYTEDIEDEEEAKERYKILKEQYKYVQLEED